MKSEVGHIGLNRKLSLLFLLQSQRIEYVEYLVDSIQVSDKVYKQVVGIPKGTNCAPLLANLFLIRCEYEFQVYERPYEITS